MNGDELDGRDWSTLMIANEWQSSYTLQQLYYLNWKLYLCSKYIYSKKYKTAGKVRFHICTISKVIFLNGINWISIIEELQRYSFWLLHLIFDFSSVIKYHFLQVDYKLDENFYYTKLSSRIASNSIKSSNFFLLIKYHCTIIGGIIICEENKDAHVF